MAINNHLPLDPYPQLGTQAWSQWLPKIDLHRHFEGSLRLDTLMEIAQAYNLTLPIDNQKMLRAHVQISNTPLNFQRFLQIFELLKNFYVSKEIIQRITKEIIADAAEDNVKYLELRFNPFALANTRKFFFNDVVEWVVEAVQKAQDVTGTRICLILQIPRKEPLNIAEEIVDIAIAHHGAFVRGVDLAGNEVQYPSVNFIQPLHRAYREGLNITIHAGEVTGPQSIYEAVTALHATRIGHGIRAVESAPILNLLMDRRITLEVCPTSNTKTNLVSDYAHHPLADLYKHKLRITLNTDDPGIFTTTSSQEIIAAVSEIGIPPHHIYRFLRYGVEAAFIPVEERPWLHDLFRSALRLYPGALEEYDILDIY